MSNLNVGISDMSAENMRLQMINDDLVKALEEVRGYLRNIAGSAAADQLKKVHEVIKKAKEQS